MAEKKDGKLKLVLEDGSEAEFDILFTFDSEETNKSYIVYTDNSKDEGGSVNTYASIYDPEGKDKKLKPIKTEKEWDLIENLLSQIEEKVSKEE